MSLSTHAAMEPFPPVVDDDIPILYEDEEEVMGEANLHAWANIILFGCLPSLLKERQPDCPVYANLNCYYEVKGRRSPRTGRRPNFASDIMIVRPYRELPATISSYTIGEDGPQPLTVLEVMSRETAANRDLNEKLVLYRKLKIKEYILVDLSGQFLPQMLLLKRLQRSGRWKDVTDPDGGLTSELGFRLMIDPTETYGLQVVDAMTGIKRIRPWDSESRVRAETDARRAETDALRLARGATEGRTCGN